MKFIYIIYQYLYQLLKQPINQKSDNDIIEELQKKNYFEN